MGYECANHPFVVWGACFLWLISMFSITWSLALFFCIGDILYLTRTDLVNAMMLMSGLIMLPTNLQMLYSIAQGKRINLKSNVLCCPIWLCILWAGVVNLAGAILCIHRIRWSKKTTETTLSNAMQFYRNIPKHKRFMDDLQWALRCCGMNSYRDWFSQNWYDKTRDYEWDPNDHKRNSIPKNTVSATDSVPLSCCKSGSCISNYLSELGTYSINTNGCNKVMNRVIMISMIGHLLLFTFVVMVEIMILRYVSKTPSSPDQSCPGKGYNVRHIMKAKDSFADSSDSNAESSDVELHAAARTSSFNMKTTY